MLYRGSYEKKCFEFVRYRGSYDIACSIEKKKKNNVSSSSSSEPNVPNVSTWVLVPGSDTKLVRVTLRI